MPVYDIHTQLIPASQYNGCKFISFGPTRSIGVRGVQKLVNMFIMALLTPTGSDPLDRKRGTDLTGLIGSNIGVKDAQDILALSVDKASKDLSEYQSGRQVDDDERFASATVTRFLFIEDAPGFSAQIYIKNVLNQQLTFLLPTLEVRAS